jgi:hypothetical protein
MRRSSTYVTRADNRNFISSHISLVLSKFNFRIKRNVFCITAGSKAATNNKKNLLRSPLRNRFFIGRSGGKSRSAQSQFFFEKPARALPFACGFPV